MLGLGEGMRRNGSQGRGRYLTRRTQRLKVMFILPVVTELTLTECLLCARHYPGLLSPNPLSCLCSSYCSHLILQIEILRLGKLSKLPEGLIASQGFN